METKTPSSSGAKPSRAPLVPITLLAATGMENLNASANSFFFGSLNEKRSSFDAILKTAYVPASPAAT